MDYSTPNVRLSDPSGRLPTVDEALPYTPFSSIVPFDSGLIPPFHALPRTPATAFDNLYDVTTVRNELAELSAGAKNAFEASERCQRTLRDVQRLMDAESLTQYKFRSLRQHTKASNLETAPKSTCPELSSYAKMVYAKIEVPFVRLERSGDSTPQARAAPVQRRSIKDSPSQPTLLGRSSTPSHPQAVVHLTSITPAERKAYEPYRQPAPTPSKSQAFVQTRSPTAAERQAYEYVPMSSLPSSIEATRALDQNAHIQNRARTVTADLRQKADEASENLRSLLSQIFEAEDYMQPDTSGETSQRSSKIFMMYDSEGRSVPLLHAKVQVNLDAAISDVIKHGSLGNIDMDDLLRLQRLCEVKVSFGQSLSLQIREHWSEHDIAEWLDRVAIVKSSLVATRTMMRIMTGGSQYKEIQSEDHLRAVLDALRTAIDGVIIPLVEERRNLGEKTKGDRHGPENNNFRIALDNRAALLEVVKSLHKCLRLLGDLFVKTNVDETGISSAEYLCRTLVFGDNAASNKESVFDDIEVFESLRRAGMNLVAKIFTKYTEQRPFIVDQILQSLEKLPANKQSARQFRLADSKPIQLVSALLMRLVQASATVGTGTKRLGIPSANDHSSDDDDDNDGDDHDIDSASRLETDSEDEDISDSDGEGIKVTLRKKGQHSSTGTPFKSGSEFASIVNSLHDAAQAVASEIVKTLLRRALQTTKSSDEPFRKLLDIFTEDFLNVLGSSDWPAAELLLRNLVGQMLGLAENHKSPAPSRSLALELLGTIGSGILDLRASTEDATKSLDLDDASSSELASMARRDVKGSFDIASFLAFDGPYRFLIEYLEYRHGGHDEAQVQTARGYHLVQWAAWLNSKEMAEADYAKTSELKRKVLHMIKDPKWLEQNSSNGSPSTALGKFAAKLVVSHSTLCRAFERILILMLKSMSNEQPTIRSRSLKSVTTLLEKNPTMLDRDDHILDSILRSLRDRSSLVRDSGLILIERCVSLRTSVSSKVYIHVTERTNDASASIRKRAVKFLKTLYHLSHDSGTRSTIANAVISRVLDADENVAEIARKTVDDIWFSGFTYSKTGVDASIELRSQVALVVQTIENSDGVALVLEALIKRLLADGKNGAKEVCKMFVATLFDAVIDSSDIPGRPSQSSVLQALTVFARAAPTLFNASQLERIEPYAANLNSQDDISVFQHVVTILRYTFPYVSGINLEVLNKLQRALLVSVSRIHSSELAVVAPCLWAITSVLKNVERLVTMVASAMNGISSRANEDFQAKPQEGIRVSRLLSIVGHFGRACDLDRYQTMFQQKGISTKPVSAYMVQLACRFTSPKNPKDLRIAALEAVCAVCQNYPQHFLREDVNNAFAMIFAERLPELEHILLTSFADFFGEQETSDDDGDTVQLGKGIESGTQRLGNTYQATHVDSASGNISQRYLTQFLRIALASTNEVALAAARIVVIINRQGRANPKDSGPCLVALETCPNESIARLAFLEHKAQYAKSESSFEQMLMHSVQLTFDYQLRVVQDASGASGQPPVSKLHFFWEVLKIGKAKTRSKFFTSMCAKIGFDPEKMSVSEAVSPHFPFTRFAVEAIAFLEYERVDELLILLSNLEKTFSNSGNPVAQAIESEVYQLNVPAPANLSENALGGTEGLVKSEILAIDPQRLHQLAVFSQVLSVISETHSFLRRAWNMQRHLGKTKKSAKDNAAKPNRAANYTALAESFQNRVNEITRPVETQDEQRSICNIFSEIFKRDDEVKLDSDGNDDFAMDENDDVKSEGSSGRSTSVPIGTPRKRKRASVSNGPPVKRKGKPGESQTKDEDEYRVWK